MSEPQEPPLTLPGPRSRGRRALFRGLALLLPVVLLLVAAEVSLRLAGSGYPTAFLEEREGVLTDNYHFSWRYFPRAAARTQQPLRITPEKGNRRRILVFGESAAMGDPEPAIGFPRMLEVLLEQRHPDVAFEVVNTAMTAVNSWAIADIAADMESVSADLALVYAGNNEVVGPFGAGTVFGAQAPPAWRVRAVLGSRRFRTGQWLQSLGEAKAGPVTWQGMEMFLQAQVPEDSPGLVRVRDTFGANLRRILTSAGKGRPVLVSAAAVNLRDCPPFGSAQRTDRSAAASLADAENSWQAAPASADAAWQLADARSSAGDSAGAREMFRRARDLDTLRFRCDSAMQQAAAPLAGTAGVTVLDVQAHLDGLSPDGIAGDGFFFEHVHFTPQGSWEVAKLFAAAAETALGLGKPDTEWASLPDCLRRLGYTPWHEMRLLEEMRQRFRRAPFTGQAGNYARIAALEARIAALRKSADPAALRQWSDEALAVSDQHPDDWRSAVQAALVLEAAGREEALTKMESAARLMPHQTVLQQQGAMLNRFKRYPAAESALRQALRLRPEFALAENSLGIALSHLERPAEAIAAWQRAVALVPDYSEARRGMASVMLAQKDTAGAEAQLRAAVAADPDDAAAHYPLGGLLTAAGRLEDALPHYTAVARLLPADAAAQVNAGALCVRLGRREEAAAYLRRALELKPGDPTAVKLLGELSPSP